MSHKLSQSGRYRIQGSSGENKEVLVFSFKTAEPSSDAAARLLCSVLQFVTFKPFPSHFPFVRLSLTHGFSRQRGKLAADFFLKTKKKLECVLYDSYSVCIPAQRGGFHAGILQSPPVFCLWWPAGNVGCSAAPCGLRTQEP